MKPENCVRDEKGRFVTIHKDWSLDNFDEGFIHKGENRFMVKVPGHHRARKDGWVFRSIVAYEAYHPGIKVEYGNEIHHKDKNRLNDSKDNLQLLSASDHASLHNPKVKREQVICNNCGVIMLKTPYQARRAKYHFCSIECKHEYGRILKTCPYCNKKFMTIKGNRQICCSLSCAGNFRYHEKTLENRIGK